MFEQNHFYNNDPFYNDDDDQSSWKGLAWGIIIVVLISLIMALIPRNCSARTFETPECTGVYTAKADCDTISISFECIKNIFQKATKTGKTTKYYCVFTYGDFSDIVSISKTTIDYINMCKQAKIRPNLALRVKNGQPVSIIKYKMLNL